ncbi:methyltransferase, FxLD system [Nonomuraea turkmeniaca]|uniref:Protein-L-isoaspartate O-methyltransferase n=1 Tax=Nonomuraea turkmeniaca TaxID=103838 RepID=A0A5S4FA26_9ACTN|nr:methyltransferase, FxLD system [Nonomuraea turkmeniaca]TMR14066.1 methyltransferase, FxLD system [Nonomuraea turkmeniaca]
MPTLDVDSEQPLRAAMVGRLREIGAIRRDEVAKAFSRVPRHAFAPEATLEEAYDPEAVVRTKWAADGTTTISSVSAPQIQARMIEQAGIASGMRVLEIGSGGFNAALLAELVGREGHVVTLDIDADITSRARRLLDENGYTHVDVVLGDGDDGCATHAPFDAIVVTVEAADIPPAWMAQLAEGGSLVAPLRVRGFTRSIGFTKRGDRLVSTSKELAGFVKMQGQGRRPWTSVLLRGGTVRLRFDEERCPTGAATLERAFEAGQAQAWTGVTVRGDESLDTLQMWLATSLNHSCVMSIDKDAEGVVELLANPLIPSMCNAVVQGDSFAYLTKRDRGERKVEIGSHAFGPEASAAANLMADLVRAWNHKHRRGPDPQYTICPIGLVGPLPEGPVVMKRYVAIEVSWPLRADDTSRAGRGQTGDW